MNFKIQLVIENNQAPVKIEEIVQFERSGSDADLIGLSLLESKQILKQLQQQIVLKQVENYQHANRHCPGCRKARRIKDHHTIQFRTLFGIITIPDIRLYHCSCEETPAKTFSLLTQLLPEHVSPELQYIETKWASLMSYDLTAKIMQDVLPVHLTQNAATTRNHLHKVAKRQEALLADKPAFLDGCPNDWGKLPKPDKPIVVGIDGGYIRNWNNKSKNFEIIAGKSFSKTQSAKRFGFVQEKDDNPRRRLMNVLTEQGMQANQQITFLSDGADNVRDLQFRMYPESEHILDWFHITMKLTVLNQFAKGFEHSDPGVSKELIENLKSTKWYLWHGNVEQALDHMEECCLLCQQEDLHYKKLTKLQKHLDELDTYIRNNSHLIPNYGERYRYGESISSAFVESTINEVVTKRMVKKQQMQWTHEGAHYMLQTRTAVLNDDLRRHFENWYPALKIENGPAGQLEDLRQAA